MVGLSNSQAFQILSGEWFSANSEHVRIFHKSRHRNTNLDQQTVVNICEPEDNERH